MANGCDMYSRCVLGGCRGMLVYYEVDCQNDTKQKAGLDGHKADGHAGDIKQRAHPK